MQLQRLRHPDTSHVQAHRQQPLRLEQPTGNLMARLARQSSLMTVPTPIQRDAQPALFREIEPGTEAPVADLDAHAGTCPAATAA